jgi:hypothetical protein
VIRTTRGLVEITETARRPQLALLECALQLSEIALFRAWPRIGVNREHSESKTRQMRYSESARNLNIVATILHIFD